MQAIKDIVLILPDKLDEMSPGGIYFTDTHFNAPDWRPARKLLAEWGTVVSCGPKCSTLAVGDRVYQGDCVGMAFVFEGSDYLAAHEKDLLLMEERHGDNVDDFSGSESKP